MRTDPLIDFFLIFVQMSHILAYYDPKPKKTAKIVQGQKATDGQFPYQVQLINEDSHHCGGSIISATQILTAAHCVCTDDLREALLSTGAIYVGSIQSHGGKLHKIANTACHPGFFYDRSTGIDHDIAIITIKGRIQLNSYTKVIPLGTGYLPAGTTCTISGWGSLGTGMEGPPTLLYGKIHVDDYNKCVRKFLRKKLKVGKRNICAGSKDASRSCFGDSGGPLVCNGYIYGVTSWGVGCEAEGTSAVYESVPKHRKWIVEQTEKQNPHEYEIQKPWRPWYTPDGPINGVVGWLPGNGRPSLEGGMHSWSQSIGKGDHRNVSKSKGGKKRTLRKTSSKR